MKTVYILLPILLLFFFSTEMGYAQTTEKRVVTYSGVVKDGKNGKRVENATVTVSGGSIGTVTNADGEFSLKIPLTADIRQIKVTHVGYFVHVETVNGQDIHDLNISLRRNDTELPEVRVLGGDATELIKEVIEKIPENYSPVENQMLGFYRETVQKRKRYINISEAVVESYKSPYKDRPGKDNVRIVKGRQLISPLGKDTIAVKLQGGPTLSVYLDFVKNPYLLLDFNEIKYYSFTYTGAVMIGDRLNYEVAFAPSHILPYALYEGKLYIDMETLGVTRAEFNLDMYDRDKATKEILKKKPFGLRFKPEELSYIVSYNYRDGLFYFNYARSKIRFKCDWKRRLFATNYTILSEVVTTDVEEENVHMIPRKEAFTLNHVFSEKVHSFVDESFWEGYNIIEPTESLETGVKKLRKQHQ